MKNATNASNATTSFAARVVATAILGTASVFFVRATAVSTLKTISAAFDMLPEK